MKRMFELFDIVRIDHFRAIDSAWAIPAHHPTAEHGEWVQGPGDELLEAILEASPRGRLVAEDLGIIPDSVVEMRKKHGLPGMAVLQFANDDADNPHNPENHTEDMVVYTGHHCGVGEEAGQGDDHHRTRITSRTGNHTTPRRDGAGLTCAHEHPRHPGGELEMAI
jgi:hypothetical protein